jgi:FAD/FMN-containing dehydrogenase
MVNPDQPNNSILEGLVDTDNVMITQAYSQINSTIKGWIDDTSNPMYNLPSKVLFPTSESDVVAAVRFAKEHGLEV